MTEYPGEFLLSLPSIPVPPSVTTVVGCSCGGSMEWHTQDCGIWSVPPGEAMTALDDGRRRLREHTDDLNRQLRAAIAASERRTHRCDQRCVCPVDGRPSWYAPSTGQHACQGLDCEYAHPADGRVAVG